VIIPCKCGHRVHEVYGGAKQFCRECLDSPNVTGIIRKNYPFFWIHNYVPDNLSYVEALAKERNLI